MTLSFEAKLARRLSPSSGIVIAVHNEMFEGTWNMGHGDPGAITASSAWATTFIRGVIIPTGFEGTAPLASGARDTPRACVLSRTSRSASDSTDGECIKGGGPGGTSCVDEGGPGPIPNLLVEAFLERLGGTGDA